MVMNREDFQILYDQLTAINNDRGKMSLALSIVKNNCLTVSYVMKYALTINDEELRLDLIKASYPRLFDLNNLRMASQVFRYERTRDSFMQYIDKQYPTHGYDPLPSNQKIVGCFVKDDEFADMVTLLGKQDFNNARLSMAQQMFISGKCFTVKQILEVLRLFDTDTSKVEIAKFATDYCVERDKCYLLADCFEFESSKKDFLAFLAGK
ncbi:MAG: hypothetical protein CVU06_02905 [Bacteroidetes bacterium HGW-Bacteroidetes-22]|nr:MAG: hypothetical protein CVU06_02905 [Bacteroidetes bacterium HGW-Bacteroidetes-22]